LTTVDCSTHDTCFFNISNTNTAETAVEVVITGEIGCSNVFNNLLHFLGFLAEVIQQTILAKDRNETIGVFKIIARATSDKIVYH